MKKKIIEGYEFYEYQNQSYSEDKLIQRSADFYDFMNTRRSIRDFSNKKIPKKVIEKLLLTASTAPSGANKQPWAFAVIENDDLKRQIRKAAEKEEFESYTKRMSNEWLEDLKPMQTNWKKPFLEIAPFLIVVFKKAYDLDENGNKHNNYYVNESVGLAIGLLLTAIHNLGLVALTHTPSPMNFLCDILKRPVNERPFLLIPIGYPSKDAYVPVLRRKILNEIATFY